MLMKSQNWLQIDENKDYGSSAYYTFFLTMSKPKHQEILYDLIQKKDRMLETVPFPPLFELRLD